MKLIGTRRQQYTFSLEKKEKNLLFQMLQLYPLVPPAHHRLSRTAEGPEHDENQKLLEESLAEQRRKNRKDVLAMLDEPGRFRETPEDWRFMVARPQMEWLLQVLNDVRVGAWLALGEPKELQPLQIDKTNASYLLAMEAAGFFEAGLLAALGVEEPGAREEE